jgi:hypothetical protein
MKKKKKMITMKEKRVNLYKKLSITINTVNLSYIDMPLQVLTASGHSQAVQ